jgi:cell fate regulator YaaT (PSP1 superfamily)
MGCSSCANGEIPAGCKSNGACATGGCDKMEVYDWLADMRLPNDQEPFDCVEVRFKNGRKGFYRNANRLNVRIGDCVAVEASPGHDIGTVTLTGELVRLQMKKKKVRDKPEALPKIYRKANQYDLDQWKEAREREMQSMYKSRELADRLGLEMKIGDVEYQGDNSKATFYYTAEERVDFRQLIKDMAREFRVRIEMRQIGARQEAARLGGLGACGRELCCSTWLNDFRSVNTSAARYQQLSLNTQKLAGQCGKLKCCLNYELDVYMDALKEFPKTDVELKTEKGTARFIKMDIFKRTIWYAYKEERSNWIPLQVDKVHQIMEMNAKGKKPEALEIFVQETVEGKEVDFHKVVGQDSLDRFDKKGQKGNKSRRRNNRNRKNGKKRSRTT